LQVRDVVGVSNGLVANIQESLPHLLSHHICCMVQNRIAEHRAGQGAQRMSKKDLEEFLAALATLDREIEADPEAADRILIDSGIYTEDGKLAPEYT
jgi:hypothetical protein